MKAAAFDKLIAQAYSVPLNSVTVHARNLKESGLLTTGARGTNAPDMKPLDAARMTIVLLSTDRPARAVESLSAYGSLTLNTSYSEGDISALGEDDRSLEGVLQSFFSFRGAVPAFLRRVEINEQMRSAKVTFSKGGTRGVAHFDGSAHDVIEAYAERRNECLQTIRGLNQAPMISVALAVNENVEVKEE
ncbi:hypothetical protein [Pontibaca salina]|uniref:Uncharacterized protein n=1 Tax=Pontibaca salina TaxID=2795731 RepID=A0A934M1E2_9RHOB|nr:hypothetical protein [Pontibaca salina]MBI6630703.1 hypothetical protein [Pontibaca salina]